MALFPAFAGCPSAGGAPEQAGLDWLTNRSFSTEDALSLHQRTQPAAPPPKPESPLSSADPKPQSSGSESSDSGAERRSKKRKKKKKKHKKPKNRKKSSEEEEDDARDGKKPQPVRDAGCGSAAGRSIWLDEAQSAPEETFRIDKKADPANWEYKSLYRGDIARYRRRGHSCLGINPKTQQIVWEDAIQKKTSQKRAERYYHREAVRTLRAEAEPVSCGKGGAAAVTSAFIPVQDCDPDSAPSAAPGPESWVNPLGVYDKSTAMWLQGKGGPEDKTTPTPERRDTGLLEKVEDYNRRVREDPGDITTWMEFVSFQDGLIHQPSMYSTSESDSHRMSLKMVLEKKLSILERAIQSNPASTPLKLARLRLCAEFWETPALLKEWQKLVFLHPNDPQLWKDYLHFSQGQFSAFSVSKVNGVYGKCLSTLSAVHDGSMLSHPALPGTERSMYDIFLQQCHFLRQAGHCEKAVSLFQALMDFTFYKPDNVKNMTTKEQVEFFEPFWDSGEPRFAEKGAKGWSSWMRQQERGGWIVINNLGEEDDEADEEIDIQDKSRPRPDIWLDMECAREARHWIPWRPDPAKKQSEEDCEDPERQVLFDDIGPSMIRISSAELRFQLVVSFLQFLGVPCDSRPPPTSLYLFLDRASIFDHTPLHERLLTSYELPLSGVSAVGHLDTMSGSRARIGQCKEGERFIQDVFQAAMSCVTGEEKTTLSVCWLQYEIAKVVRCLQEKNKKKLKSQGKRSKRLAKGLLKEPANRNSLALWREYALLERLLGNNEEARKVFDAAIALAGGRGLKDRDLRSLCLLYAELEAETAAEPEHEAAASCAVHVLTSLADSAPYVPYKGPVPALSILKARKAYERVLEDSLNTPSDPALVTVTGCLALFQYLTAGIDSAAAVFRQVSDSLAPPAGEGIEARGSWSPLQAMTVMHTNLLKYHTRVSVYPRGPLRDALMDALRLYPHNVTLWKSYIRSESRCHRVNKVRRFIDGVRRAAGALEPYLFAIRAEEERKELVESVKRGDSGDVHIIMPETGLSNRIKALFERGLSTEQGSRCLLLWRMYIRFMVSQGPQDRARGLFYKAIQSCPWAKVLYLDAVEYFPDQLQEIVDLMMEKELRVRLPLEELDLLLED